MGVTAFIAVLSVVAWTLGGNLLAQEASASGPDHISASDQGQDRQTVAPGANRKTSVERSRDYDPQDTIPKKSKDPVGGDENSPDQIKLHFYEKGTGVPLNRVEVKVGEKRVYSGADGRITVSLPPSFGGKVQISRRGYEPEVVEASLLRAAPEHEVYLFPKLGGDDVIIVRGERRTSISRKTVSAEESQKVAPGGDPAQVVKLLPGVQTAGFGTQVVVRGSGPDDTKYYIDDLEVPFVFHLIGNLSLVPTPLLSEVQFDSGGFGPEFGDATGGVIVLRTTSEIPDRPMTEFLVNVPLYSGLYHQRPLSDDSMISVSVRRSYVDAIIRAALEQQKKEDDSLGSLTIAPHFTDAHVFYLDKSNFGHLKTSLIAAEDGMRAVFPTDAASNEDGTSSVNFSTRFVNFGVEKMTRLGRDWKYRSTPQIYYMETLQQVFGNDLAFRTTQFRIPTEITHRLSKDEDLYFGVDPAYFYIKQDVYSIIPRFSDPTYDFEDAEREKIVDSEDVGHISAWVGLDQQFGKLKLTPGVRGFYSRLGDKASFDPRLRSQYAATPEQTVKLAVGQYSKHPSGVEPSKNFGNPNLSYERSIHYVLGLDSKWSDAWTTEFQIFHKRAFDVVGPNPETRYDNDASFRSTGAEAFIRRNLTSRMFGWISYTWSKTEERDEDTQPFRPAQYDQTHVVNLAANYSLTSTWSLGGRYNHHTGDTYTPVGKAVYNASLDKYQPRDEPKDRNKGRLPDYNSLTLYLTHDFLFDTWKMSLKTGVESYWFTPQVLGVQNNYDYSKEEKQEGIGPIPFLEVRGEL